MKLQAFIQSKIDAFRPEYQDLKFKNEEAFLIWLVETTEVAVVLKDSGQDLLKLYVAKSGEVIHTEIPTLGNIYNGSLLLDNTEIMIASDHIRLWVPKFKDVVQFKYEVEKVLRKSSYENS